MAYISNNAGQSTGTTLGNQNIGRMTMSYQGQPSGWSPLTASVGSGGHDGMWHGYKYISLNSVSGQYDERFDDPTYYG